MSKTALMLGSIGVVVESSDIQRRAYNAALREAGLAWDWDAATYAELLTQAGGKERLAMLAAATGQRLSEAQIETIHARKTQMACEELERSHVALRTGVAALMRVARTRGMKLAFVTTTYRPNIDAIFAAAGDALKADDFDYIGTRADVAEGKPAPDAYHAALGALGVRADEALAVEDTATSVMSAKRAGLAVVATPGQLTGDQDFWQADLVLPALGEGDAVDPRVLALLD